jgi:hypothetical protein
MPRNTYINLSFRITVALNNIVPKKFFIKNYDITNLCVRLFCLVAIPKGKFEDDVIVVWIERLEIHGEDMILP